MICLTLSHVIINAIRLLIICLYFDSFLGEFKANLEKCEKQEFCQKLKVASVKIEDGMKHISQKFCDGNKVEVKSGDLTLCDRKVVTATKSIFNEESIKLFNLLFMIFLL